MRYQGSKAKLAKYIIPIVTQHLTDDKIFVDLFGGGMNLVDKVDHKRKIACDINKYVIDLWDDIKTNGMRNIPKHVTQEEYMQAKQDYLNNDFSRFTKAQMAYIATCCSYGGAWFNGYAHFNPNKNEDHIAEAYNGLSKQVENFKHLQTTKFMCFDYWDFLTSYMVYTKDMIVYADPPYADRRRYESDFDSELFWERMRNISKLGVKVYVSEYEAPSDFRCVWEKEVADGMGTTVNGRKQKRKTEKLFVYNGEG